MPRCKAVIGGLKCGIKFEQKFTGHSWCCDSHQDIFIAQFIVKNKEKQKLAREKKARKKQREDKQKIKTNGQLMSEADKAFQRYIRLRDADKLCINEGVYIAWNDNQSDAAHYISKAENKAMRYDLRNCHKSTKKSNANQEKYIHAYTDNLKERIGIERYEALMTEHRYWKTHKRGFNREYYIRVKKIFDKKYKILLKNRK